MDRRPPGVVHHTDRVSDEVANSPVAASVAVPGAARGRNPNRSTHNVSRGATGPLPPTLPGHSGPAANVRSEWWPSAARSGGHRSYRNLPPRRPFAPPCPQPKRSACRWRHDDSFRRHPLAAARQPHHRRGGGGGRRGSDRPLDGCPNGFQPLSGRPGSGRRRNSLGRLCGPSCRPRRAAIGRCGAAGMAPDGDRADLLGLRGAPL